MTTSQPFDESTPNCGACGVPCERAYSCTTAVDMKTGAVTRRDYRCFDCDERERWVEFEQTHILRTRLLEDAAHEAWLSRNNYPEGWKRCQAGPDLLTEVIVANDWLRDACKRFERKVWRKGLKAKVRARGGGQRVIARTAEVQWLAWTGGGRCLVTLEHLKDDCSITLIGSDDEDEQTRMGIQGVHGKLEDVLALVDTALGIWGRKPPKPKVIRDDEVRYPF